MKNRPVLTLALALALGGLAADAQAQAVITNGTVTLGVNSAGHLNLGSGLNPLTNARYGLSVGAYEATSPGCLCEGWGAGVSGGTFNGQQVGYNMAHNTTNSYGNATGTVLSFGATASTATSVVNVRTSGGATFMRVTHEYLPSVASALYEVRVTIENLTGSVLGTGTDGIRYRRVMDWDVQPTAFSEFVTIYGNGTAANLLGTSNNGFARSLVFDARSSGAPGCANIVDTDFTDVGPCDHGALFDFGFGALDPFSSVSFKTFYGGATGANAEATMLAALSAVGAEVYSLGQCNTASNPACDPATGTPVTFAFGFAGVGGTPISTVPEPGTVFLLATGLLGLGIGYRRRTRDAAE